VITALTFLIAIATAVAMGAAVRRVAPVVGAVVPPRPDRWSSAPTPSMGGIAIALGTIAGFILVGLASPDAASATSAWAWVLLAALAMFVVGFYDDRLQLSPIAKLVASLVIGAFLVFALSGAEPAGALPPTYTLLGTVWFAGLCHAMNLLDNMDGLATGVAIIATAFLAALLSPSLGPMLVALMVSLTGALVGFLYWNRPRAKLFMGDCGSLFIGAMLAGSSLVPILNARVAFVSPAVLVVLILVVPLFDTAFVLVLRRLAGRKASKGGTDHVSHRLVSLGFSERSAVRILYLFGLIGGLAAWGIQKWSAVEPMLPFVALFGVIVILIGVYLARVPAYNAQDFIALQKSSFAPFLKDLAFRWHAGQVMLDLVLITVCYYVAYRLRFEGASLDPFLQYFLSTLPIVLGCKLAALLGSGLYQRSWETFGLRDLTTVVRGVGIGSLLTVAASYYLYRGVGSSRVVFVLDALLLGAAIIATRVSFQAMNLLASERNKKSRRVLVYGAGGYGRLLVREMRANSAWRMNPIGFIDDDPLKAHRWIVGVPVHGAIDQLEQVMRVYKVDEVLLSSPAINGNVEVRIREVCAVLERPVRRLRMEIS